MTLDRQDAPIEAVRPSSRIVCDTNMVVSAALFPRSVPGRAFDLARHSGSILTTPDLVAELRDVFARPKFDRYVAAPLRDEFLAAYVVEAEFVIVLEVVDACRDAKDNRVLEAAINGEATCIISGDGDLLALSPFRGTLILKPAEYLAHYGESPD